MDRRHSVLVVDDELDILEGARDLLSERYDVYVASSGQEALQLARDKNPSVVVLDILMPQFDGYATCESLRKMEETRHIPVIMLTALKESLEKVRAFHLGADDFVSKPFDPDELIARIDAKVRRLEESSTKPKPKNAELVCGNLVMRLDGHEVLIGGREVKLTILEFNLLQFLIENKGKLKSRQEIIESVWKEDGVSHRLLDPHILSLRKILNGFDHQITTVYGGGYVLKPSQDR